MKKTSVIVLAVLGLVFSAYADAAKPKRRTRNANRVGTYGGAVIGLTNYTSDQAANEAFAVDLLEDQGDSARNISVTSEDSDIGYQAMIGYRFNRYIAAELGLVQFGDLKNVARGENEYDGVFYPSSMTFTYTMGGPMMSAIGILPINDRFEIFARGGVIFASTEREIQYRVDGENGGSGSGQGDSTEMVLGAGASFHFNQIYSLRAEFLRFDSVGEQGRTGQEDFNVIGLGFIIRF